MGRSTTVAVVAGSVLVAGPVLHHGQMMPQFAQRATYRIDWTNIAAGLTYFAIGLFKKVVVADGFAPYADALYRGFDTALDMVRQIFETGGRGHSCGIYSTSDDNIMKLAMATKTSRIMVNQPQAPSNSGNLWNGMRQKHVRERP